MQELRVSNQKLGNPEAIREALESEGYVFFRDVIDRRLLAHVKRGVMAWFEAENVIEVVDDAPMYNGQDMSRLGEYPAGLTETNMWEWFALRPELQGLYQDVFGEAGWVLPIGSYQFHWPGRPDCWSRIHQDGPHNVGMHFLTFWFPLMPIPEELGGLAIVPRPASLGSLHGKLEDGEVTPYIAGETFSADDWYRSDYQPGDVLIFGLTTPHCGMPNASDRLRLSIDIRVQAASAPRPIEGVVLAGSSDSIVIASDAGDLVSLAVDSGTYLRPDRYGPRPDPHDFVGRRVLATEEDGCARLIRIPQGHLPRVT